MRLLLIIMLAFLISCRGVVDELTEMPRPVGETTVPLQKRNITQYAHFREAQKKQSFSDFFTIDRAVPLEPRPDALLTDVKDLVLLGDQWVILDQGGQIFRYAFEGRYLGPIGRIGQGPGEYQSPSKLYVWDDKLIVDDGGSGNLLRYDDQGHFMHRFHGRNDRVYRTTANLFHEDRWYAIGFLARDARVPDHAMFEVNEAGEPTLLGGFGQRFEWTCRPSVFKQAGGLSWLGYTIVDNRIWTGSPYRSDLQIFDTEGRFVAHLLPGIPDGVQPQDFEGITDRSGKRELLSEKYMSGPILSMGPYVFASYVRTRKNGLRNSVFDREGNLIKKNIPGGEGLQNPFLSKPCGPYLVQPLPDHLSAEMLQKKMTNQEWERLLETGYDPVERENPTLVLSLLRDDVLPEKDSH